jgi:hypothetical protein
VNKVPGSIRFRSLLDSDATLRDYCKGLMMSF